MPTPTVDQYEDLIRRSGIVEKDVLDRALATINPPTGKLPLDQLSRRLMEARLITEWQNEKLMEGRHRGFFLGKYKLLQHLSRGGMSEVYLAEQVMMRRRVAIKVFPPDLIEKASYLERFYQESRTQASMDHPNIVRAHDFGNEGKIHYLVMEYVDGPDLENLVKEQGPLPFEVAASYIQQAAEALAYAHSRKMVHRDIKPSNLMLDRASGLVKLLDLGLVRITGQEQASLTLKHNENTLGTADYLAPEQAVDSHTVDTRADIYSLGGTLYYVLTGHPPFPEGTPVQRLMMHMNQEPASILLDRPDCPPELIAICAKMMAKKPEHRYQTAGEVREVLGEWLEANGYASMVSTSATPEEPKPKAAEPERRAPNPRVDSNSETPRPGAGKTAVPAMPQAPRSPRASTTNVPTSPRSSGGAPPSNATSSSRSGVSAPPSATPPSASPAGATPSAASSAGPSTPRSTKVLKAPVKKEPPKKPLPQDDEQPWITDPEEASAASGVFVEPPSIKTEPAKPAKSEKKPAKGAKAEGEEGETEAAERPAAAAMTIESQLFELAYAVAIGAVAGAVVYAVYGAGRTSWGSGAVQAMLVWAAYGALPGAVIGSIRLVVQGLLTK